MLAFSDAKRRLLDEATPLATERVPIQLACGRVQRATSWCRRIGPLGQVIIALPGKPAMVDVADKPSTRRSAVAEAVVELGAEVMSRLSSNDIRGPKGPVFRTAIIAGTMAVKQTSTLIPLCAVWVGVAAAHRDGAFEACRAILERLKHELPIWRKETYADGTVEWVGPDNQAPEISGARPDRTDRTDRSDRSDLPEMHAELHASYLSEGYDFRGRHGQERMDHGIIQVGQVECVAGMGLRGDRYFGY